MSHCRIYEVISNNMIYRDKKGRGKCIIILQMSDVYYHVFWCVCVSAGWFLFSLYI
jgi:hypothetical protein